MRQCGLVALALILAACSSSTGGKTGASSASAGGTASLTLKVALGVVGVPYTPIFVAQYGDYFKAQNLTVDVQNPGAANVVNSVVAGTADLGVQTIASAMSPVAGGKSTTSIYNYVGNNPSVLFAKPGVNSVNECKRVATLTPGTSNYGLAVRLKDVYKANYAIVTVSDNPTSIALFSSGQADCLVASKASALNLVTAGTAHLLIDFGTQQYPDFPTGLPIVVVWGLTDHIGSQREAVVRFLRALNNAAKFMKTAQPAAIAAVIMKDPDIAQQGTLAQLTAQVAATGYTFVPNDGNISETGWTGALSFAESSGVPGFKASNPQYQYAVRVDMSYLNDANK